jgi:hypothetical protein
VFTIAAGINLAFVTPARAGGLVESIGKKATEMKRLCYLMATTALMLGLVVFTEAGWYLMMPTLVWEEPVTGPHPEKV